MKNINQGVRKAIQLAGSKEALAIKLNCSRQAVRKMEFNNCTAERAIQIEQVTGIPREEIRPDIFVKPIEIQKQIVEPQSKKEKKIKENVV